MKKVISLFLALMMLVSMAPLAAAEEKPVLTVAMPDHQQVEDFNTNAQTLLLEEKLGVDLQIEIYPRVDYNAKINMMIQTGGKELPDVIIVGNASDAEMLSWIESGMLVPLNKYYDDPALSPNIHDAYNRLGVDFSGQVTMFDGNIYGIPTYNQSHGNEYAHKTWINQTWLDALNMQVPTTPDELYELLVAVKNTDLNGNGKADEMGLIGTMPLDSDSYDGWFTYIMNAYIYAGDKDYYTVNDGVVDIAYNKPEWKEGLKFMAKLFAEGLIPKEILTQDSNQYKTMLNSELCTTLMVNWTSLSRVNSDLSWRNDFVSAVPLTNQTTGKPLSTYRPSVANNGAFFITKNCADPDLAFKFGDMLVSEVMSITTRWGKEGYDWDYCKNLDPAFVDTLVPTVGGFEKLIYEHDTGNGGFWSQALQNNAWMQTGPYIREYGIANGRAVSPEKITAFNEMGNQGNSLYQSNGYRPDEVIPKLIYSAEEMEIIADINTTLKEFRKEWTANFLAGNLDIDANWDAYVAELDTIGVQQVLEVVQGVYDRMYK